MTLKKILAQSPEHSPQGTGLCIPGWPLADFMPQELWEFPGFHCLDMRTADGLLDCWEVAALPPPELQGLSWGIWPVGPTTGHWASPTLAAPRDTLLDQDWVLHPSHAQPLGPRTDRAISGICRLGRELKVSPKQPLAMREGPEPELPEVVVVVEGGCSAGRGALRGLPNSSDMCRAQQSP